MDSLSAASIRYRIAIGPHSGSRTLTLHDPSFIRTDKPEKASTADRDGFSLNAAVSCQPYQRARLERLCKYVTRPAICLDRLIVRADGKIQYELKNPFRNGTTHMLFSPLDFLSKLAALVPRPRHNLVRYHGEEYRISANSVGGLWNFSQYGAPMQWGVEVGMRFN